MGNTMHGPSVSAANRTHPIRPEREVRHRDAQGYESLAGKLRKLANYLLHSLRAQADIGQLNSQLASLELAAEILEWLAQDERIEARCDDGDAKLSSTIGSQCGSVSEASEGTNPNPSTRDLMEGR